MEVYMVEAKPSRKIGNARKLFWDEIFTLQMIYVIECFKLTLSRLMLSIDQLS